MKVLMVNKFLYPNGGSETYIFKLGEALIKHGHEVQYFGMDHPERIVGNRVETYTRNMDFHVGTMLSKVAYPIKTVYSFEARKKIRVVLDDFQPDVCHINNFNYQLTPSIICEIRKWERKSGHKCKIIYTAHDSQLVCPNHLLKNPCTGELCKKCLGGHFFHCVKSKCIHSSTAKSLIGAFEGYFWKWKGVYKQFDTVICPSRFMQSILDSNCVLATKTAVLHNFVDAVEQKDVQKKDYVLYFGRYSVEKGILTLVKAAKELPDIPFVFAGSGPLEFMLNEVPNITNVGFQTGESLETLIREARFSVYPSEWYENCPFSVVESQMYGTPVLGADIGGIPELIKVGRTGELFESGSLLQLKTKIQSMWNSPRELVAYAERCTTESFCTIDTYYSELMSLYKSENCN